MYCKSEYEVAEMIYAEDMGDVEIIGNYDFIVNIFKYLLFFDFESDYYQIAGINIGIPEYEGYDGPYLLSICEDGEIWCEKAILNNKFLKFDAKKVLIESGEYLEDAKKSCLTEDPEFFIVYIGDDLHPSEDSSGFHILTNDEDDPCGFEYHDEGYGYCYNIRYCSCEPKDMNSIVETYNRIAKEISKLI